LCTYHATEFRHRVIQLGPGPLPWTDGPPVSRVRLLPDWVPFQRRHVQRAVGGDLAGRLDGRCVMHAWTPNAARRSAMVIGEGQRMVIEVFSTRAVPGCVVWPRSGRMTDVPRYVCPTTAVRRALLRAGVPEECCIVIRPAAEPIQVNLDRRAQLRADVGLEPDEIAVLPLPPVTRETGAIWVAWATLLAANVRPDVRLIVPDGDGEAERICRLVRACRHEHVARLARSGLKIAELISISDVIAFLPAEDAPVDTLYQAALSGRPLVVTALPYFAELVEDSPHTMSCQPRCPADAARAILAAIESRPSSAGHYDRRPDRQPGDWSAQKRVVSSYLSLYKSLTNVQAVL
jgi:hypothetical protein